VGRADDETHDRREFVTGKPLPVCGNTAEMLSRTRFGAHFEVTGDRSVHYGPFPCGPDAGADGKPDEVDRGCCYRGD